MNFKFKKINMSQELSTELITHKLKIKGEWVKYITRKFAENIYGQLIDKEKTNVIIANPKTLTFITKYKSEVDLIPLDKDSQSFEDTLYYSWLPEHKKELVREARELRKKENKTLTILVLKNIIDNFK